MNTPLALATALALAHACAPQVAPSTLLSLASAESGLYPLTIGVNSRPHRSLHPDSVQQAVEEARALAARGVDFDVGLAQINARNLPRLGLDLTHAFEPCLNLAAGARVLTENFTSASDAFAEPQAALRAALSRYNTGDPARGLRNGYVDRVYLAAARIVPALQLPRVPVEDVEAPLEPVRLAPAIAPAPTLPASPSLDVFARRSAALVWGKGPGRAEAQP